MFESVHEFVTRANAKVNASRSSLPVCPSVIEIAIDESISGMWGTAFLASAINNLPRCETPCRAVQGLHSWERSQNSTLHLVWLANQWPLPGHTLGPEQKIVRMETEPMAYGNLLNQLDNDNLDIFMSIDRRSHIPLSYWYGFAADCGDNNPFNCISSKNPSQPPDMSTFRSSKAVAVLVCSNCDAQPRKDYVNELRQYVSVDVFGACGKSLKGYSQEEKMQVLRSYKFYLAFENSLQFDYVTEKFFGPITVDTVMVYLGAPNIEDFAPGSQSFINAMDFTSPRDLADYLLFLDKNDTAYLEYFAWRRSRRLSESLLQMIQYDLIANGTNSWLCRSCQLYAQNYCRIARAH